MKSIIGAVLVFIGVGILLLGVAAPSTSTQTSTTCYDSPTGYGQDCVQSSYETPNTGKGGMIGAGIFVAIIGGILTMSNSSSAESSGQSSQDGTQSLKDQIQERQSEREQKESVGVDK
ncbi:hypothetical protein [Natrinema pallidum]|uniref:hypothetical protein n=1 Tax=Natrinema pallidum TaxID=69527 RepID=UPI0012691CB9|nr:hypothetical protein [Natrinema pallidum]